MKKSLETALNEATTVGLKFLGPYIGVQKKTKYFCHLHGEIEQTPNKVQQGFGCPSCGRKKGSSSRRTDVNTLSAAATAVNLIFVGPPVTANEKTAYECLEHGLIYMRPATVSIGRGCKSCSMLRAWDKRGRGRAQKIKSRDAKVPLDLLMQRAERVGLRYDDEYKTSHELARYQCAVHGSIQMRPAVVRRGGGCAQCSGNVQKDEQTLQRQAAEVGLEFLGPVVNDRKRTTYRCPTHGLIQKRPGDVKSGKGCRSCARYGFDVSAPAVLYVYRVTRVNGDDFIGFGITGNLQTRHAVHTKTFDRAGATGRLIKTVEFNAGQEALRLESNIKKSLKKSLVNTGLEGFFTEAVPADQEGTLMSLICQQAIAAA